MDIFGKIKEFVQSFNERSAQVRAAQEDWNQKAEAYVAEHGITAFEKAMDAKPK